MRVRQWCCSFRCARFADGVRLSARAKRARAVKAGRASGAKRRELAWEKVAHLDKGRIWARAYEMGYKHGWLVGRRLRKETTRERDH